MSLAILLNHGKVIGDRVLWPGTAPELKAANDGTYSIGDTEYNCQISARYGSTPILSMPVNTTGYSKLRVTVRCYCRYNVAVAGMWLISADNWKRSGYENVRNYIWYNGTPSLAQYCAYRYQKQTTSGSATLDTTETVEIDISNLNGLYYLDCGAAVSSGDAGNRPGRVYISSIELLR